MSGRTATQTTRQRVPAPAAQVAAAPAAPTTRPVWSPPVQAAPDPAAARERAARFGHRPGQYFPDVAEAAPGSGRPLPAPLRAQLERSVGGDFAGVRVHEGREAGDVGALAYTRGENLHFAPGRYDPSSPRGQALIAHELTHVVQQRQGRVASPPGGGAPVNAAPHLEAEADQVAARLGQEAPAAASPAPSSRSAGGPVPVQPTPWDWYSKKMVPNPRPQAPAAPEAGPPAPPGVSPAARRRLGIAPAPNSAGGYNRMGTADNGRAHWAPQEMQAVGQPAAPAPSRRDALMASLVPEHIMNEEPEGMSGFHLQRQMERSGELAALGGGRAYKAPDVSAHKPEDASLLRSEEHAKLLAEHPQVQSNTKRGLFHNIMLAGSGGPGVFGGIKRFFTGIPGGISNFLSERVTRRPFNATHDRNRETTGDTALRYAKGAGKVSAAIGKKVIPGVNIGVAARQWHHGNQGQQDAQKAVASASDPLTKAYAQGSEVGFNQDRREGKIGTFVNTVGLAASAATGGVGGAALSGLPGVAAVAHMAGSHAISPLVTGGLGTAISATGGAISGANFINSVAEGNAQAAQTRAGAASSSPGGSSAEQLTRLKAAAHVRKRADRVDDSDLRGDMMAHVARSSALGRLSAEPELARGVGVSLRQSSGMETPNRAIENIGHQDGERNYRYGPKVEPKVTTKPGQWHMNPGGLPGRTPDRVSETSHEHLIKPSAVSRLAASDRVLDRLRGNAQAQVLAERHDDLA